MGLNLGNEVVASLAVTGRSRVELLSVEPCLELLILFFEAFDDLLAEVRPLGELLLNFFVNRDVPVQRLDQGLLLVILRHELFSLLRLILQLARQLYILDLGQPRRCLLLVGIQSQQRCFRLFNLVEHLSAQSLRRLQLFSFFLGDLAKSVFPFLLDGLLKRGYLTEVVLFLPQKLLCFFVLSSQALLFGFQNPDYLVFLPLKVVVALLPFCVVLNSSLVKFFSLLLEHQLFFLMFVLFTDRLLAKLRVLFELIVVFVEQTRVLGFYFF